MSPSGVLRYECSYKKGREITKEQNDNHADN